MIVTRVLYQAAYWTWSASTVTWVVYFIWYKVDAVRDWNIGVSIYELQDWGGSFFPGDIVYGITMVTVSGNVDIAGSEILEAALNQHLNDGVSKLVLDLSDVGFVSSSGLRVLLKTAQSLQRSEGRMRLCEANETVREIFGISGFDKILEIAGSREEALTGMD